MAELREWVLAQKPPVDRTTHWWPADLPDAPRNCFNRIAKCQEIDDAFRKKFPKQQYGLEVVDGMNEVYVACRTGDKANSDTVFYMHHVDGPYGIWPFCHVYRCLVAITPNDLINTQLPFAHADY